MYNSGSDILGILIARVSGRSLDAFFRERIFAPLGMKDTGFSVPEAKLDRLAPSTPPTPRTRSSTSSTRRAAAGSRARRRWSPGRAAWCPRPTTSSPSAA
jgi:CubicO group peptidase (beta-lactamase class C family)